MSADHKGGTGRVASAQDDSPSPKGWTTMRNLRSTKKKKNSGAGDAEAGNANGSKSQIAESTIQEELSEVRSDDELLGDDEDEDDNSGGGVGSYRDGRPHRVDNIDGAQDIGSAEDATVYKVYKRRWFGLLQLVLLNIVVSWDWLTFSANSTTSAQYFECAASTINWLSTGFLFAFVIAAPFVIYTIHRGGPKSAIITASVLLLAGNWIRYGGTVSKSFGAVMFGQILTGLAQPFVLAAPTRYSELWFTGAGRVAATAAMSLANPLGGALAQLIDPFWADQPSDIPNMVLYVSIISAVATIPSVFIPARPPTPCSASSTDTKQGIISSIRTLSKSPEFWMITVPYAVLVGFFNSISSLINQILEPYGFSETEAGIAGALLIVVGLLAAAVSSPLIDRSKKYLLAIKLQVPIVSLCYLAFIWAPPAGPVAVYIILSILGAASFSLVPIVLEYLCEITHPISPEITSTICWTGGQLLGGIFIVISSVLTDGPNGGTGGSVPYNLQRDLWFQAALALAIVPLPLALGMFGRGKYVRMRRVEADGSRARHGVEHP